jgi:DNA-binding response OmpR family regulator
MRALIVEESKTLKAEIKGALIKAGFQVLECRNSAEGLDLLQDPGGVDLALVDWELPEADGLRFALGLRSVRRFDAIRLVMLAQRPSTAVILEAVRLGVDDCLVKRFTRKQLIEKLAQIHLVKS